MKYNISLILAIISILLIIYLFFYSIKEGFEDNSNETSFLKSEEGYFKAREDDGLQTIPSADVFLDFDNANNKLIANKPQESNIGADTYAPVDTQVEQCKKITSCDELDGTNCGYCFYNNKFYYGDENGPKTDVCPGGWVKTKEECVERRERAICDRVTSCQNMIGDAAICAWCPTKNKAFVYKKENGKVVPKYSKDVCIDVDISSGQDLGLVLQKECNAFKQEHPCIGPNEDTGPHSQQCLNHLWKEGGCPSNGTAAPENSASGRNWWNQRGWKAVLSDMKAWFSDANSSDWNLAKTHHKGCYGTDPDPCDPKYNGPLECYQKKFVSAGCSAKGSLYPKTKPNIGIANYEKEIKTMISNAHDKNVEFSTRNKAYNGCYGGQLAAPPPIKVGDKVKYLFDSNLLGKNTTIQGYVCEINGGKAKVFWEMVNDSTGKKHATRIYHLDNPELMKEVLGAYCGDVPSKLKELGEMIPVDDLILESSCNSDTSCDDASCGMQNIVYIHYPNTSYSVPKNKVEDIITKARGVFNSTKLAYVSDIQYLVDIGIPYCACGWVNQNGQLTSLYPSVSGTSGGCGGGQEKIISCGSNGPSWANGKAGVYARIDADPSKIVNSLKKVGITASIIATVGKNEYAGLIGNIKS